MNKQALEYLNNYHTDLKFNLYRDGDPVDADALNFFTSGTPFFDTPKEAEEYCEELKRFINKLETSLILDQDDIASVANVLEFIDDYSHGAGFLPNQGEPLTDHTIATAEDLLRSHKVLNPPENKTYEIMIQAIITKTITVNAEDEDKANEEAHEQFHNYEGYKVNETYGLDTLRIEEIIA